MIKLDGNKRTSLRRTKGRNRYTSFTHCIANNNLTGEDDFKILLFLYSQKYINEKPLYNMIDKQIPEFNKVYNKTRKGIAVPEIRIVRRTKKVKDILDKTLTCEGREHPILPFNYDGSMDVYHFYDIFGLRILVPEEETYTIKQSPFSKTVSGLSLLQKII